MADFLSKYYNSILLSSLLIKVLVVGASIGDAICLIALCGLSGFNIYLESKKEKSINQVFKEEQIRVREELEMIKAAMQSMKLMGGIRRS